ncbi:hypothetical protein ONZ51_g11188 [Trametes cubensis]|uniref:Uncharacterized protein n=1 Tax=Trametes cubensis TaxID=1111947 RepID=A0AAD7X5M4_9APHY|nr:hypothetical protein ONZ51_g11188 [Trametes cubensis]
MTTRIVYSPTPGSYAVIRLNPVEMVRSFNDSEALNQAQAMQPKSYLVYLHWELALPFPDQPWYKFDIRPIATSLRPEDKARCISSDMCIPIYPNTKHPNGREPLRPQPEGLFPYDNCYHWFDMKARVRIRARPEEFDETNAVALDFLNQEQMLEYWDEDGLRMGKNQRKREAEAALQHSPDALTDVVDVLPKPTASIDRVDDPPRIRDAGLQSPLDLEDADGLSMCSDCTTASEERSMCSLDDLAAMNIFSGPNDDVDVMPLVDLWISELAEHLKPEDIPSPLEMYAEFDHIANIVRQARVRSYAALMAPAHLSNEDTDSMIDDIASEKTKFKFWPPGYRRKLRAQVKRLNYRLKSMLRPPYIPIWP